MFSKLFVFLATAALIELTASWTSGNQNWIISSSDGWYSYTNIRSGMEETIETLKNDHGIIVEEIYSVAGTRGSDCIPTKIDFNPFVDGLRASVKDFFAELKGEGETPQETEMMAKRRENLERAVKNQQKELEQQMEYELSMHWGSQINGQSDYSRTSLTVGYETKQLKDLYHHKTIRQEIKESLEKGLPDDIADLSFTSRLYLMFSNYRTNSMVQFNKIIRKLSSGEVPQDIFNSEEDIKKLMSQSFYEKSVYRHAPFDSLSMMSARIMSRPSKLEIITEICLELYTDKSNHMLLKIETVPKLKENYYAQSVLPEYIVVRDDEKTFNMVSTIIEDSKKSMIIGGTFCGKMYLLPEDCNVKERKGCAYVVTPKNMADAPKLSEKTVKLARKNGKAANQPKIDF